MIDQNSSLRCACGFLMPALCTLVFALSGMAEDLLVNGDFTHGSTGWEGLGSSVGGAALIEPVDGVSCLRMERTQPGEAVVVQQGKLAFKPQTWYRLSVTGMGDGAASISLRPQSSQDPEYQKLAKSWATSSCPLPPARQATTETLLIDSGLKIDGGVLKLILEGKKPGSYRITAVSLREIASSRPEPSTTVLAHLGDSITITSYLPFSQRIDALLLRMIADAAPKRTFRTLNFAADGEYTADLLDSQRYDKVIKENHPHIDIAIVRYGTNDQIKKFTPTDFKARLSSLCDRLESDYPAITIILGTGPYTHDQPAINRQYGEHWEAVRDLALQRHYRIADIYRGFEKAATSSTARRNGDMHPSAFGVEIAAGVEFEILRPLLQGKP
jgi:hypothetical protein